MKRFFCLVLCLFSFCFAEEKNAIIVCDNGLEMFGWDLEFVRHARHSVDISACFFGGEIARELLAELEARLEACPDLQVRILATPVLLEKEDYRMIEHLKSRFPHKFKLEHATNVTIVWPNVSGIDNHVKMCVVDEQYFSIGGTNLDTTQCSVGTYTPPRNTNKLNVFAENLPAGMRDQDIVGRGPLAKELRKTFCQLFALWHEYNKTHRLERDPEAFADNSYYFEVAEKPFVERFEISTQLISLEERQIKFLLSGPHQKENVITKEYVRLIKEAKREIRIANPYLCPADEIMDALLDAVNRGIKLTIISNGVGQAAPDYTKYFCWANRVSYIPLFHGKPFHFWDYWSVRQTKPKNTRIYEYHVEDILLHKKIIIVDDDVFGLGSYNLGLKSHIADYETLLVIRSPEVVEEALKVHNVDLEHSREVAHNEAIEWYFSPSISYLGEIQKRINGFF